jgi:CysZ protein
MTLWKAILRSFRDLFSPQIVLFLVLSPLFSLLLWGIVFFLFAWNWIDFLEHWISNTGLFLWLENLLNFSNFSYASKFLAIFFIMALFIPLTYISTIILLSLFAMPVVVKTVHEKYYGNLVKVPVSSFRFIGNTLWFSFVFIVLLIVTLPLWLLPGMQIFLPMLLAAFYNRNIFTYDALGDFSSHQDIKQFKKTYQSDLLLLGFFLGVLAYIPVVCFFAPVIGALSYTHYCLGYKSLEQVS